MKRILAVAVLALAALPAMAHGYYGHYGHHGYRGGYYDNNAWIAPIIIGGIIGYGLSRPRTEVIVEQQPIIVQPQQMVVQQPPAGYRWQQMIDPQTNTLKIVLVPNQ